MSNTIEGANGVNESADFFETSDSAYYEESGEGEQIYLESVLPQAFDPNLEPFNTRALKEQNQFGFHPKPPNPYEHTYDNGNKYFTPENKEQVI
jgi:hypothetical protein